MKLRLLILCLVAISQCDADGGGAETWVSKDNRVTSDAPGDSTKTVSTNTMTASEEWLKRSSIFPNAPKRPAGIRNGAKSQTEVELYLQRIKGMKDKDKKSEK